MTCNCAQLKPSTTCALNESFLATRQGNHTDGVCRKMSAGSRDVCLISRLCKLGQSASPSACARMDTDGSSFNLNQMSLICASSDMMFATTPRRRETQLFKGSVNVLPTSVQILDSCLCRLAPLVFDCCRWVSGVLSLTIAE